MVKQIGDRYYAACDRCERQASSWGATKRDAVRVAIWEGWEETGFGLICYWCLQEEGREAFEPDF